MPLSYQQCFDRVVKVPEKDLSGDQLFKLFVKTKRSELEKVGCGKDVIAWYDTVRKQYSF